MMPVSEKKRGPYAALRSNYRRRRRRICRKRSARLENARRDSRSTVGGKPLSNLQMKKPSPARECYSTRQGRPVPG